MNGIIVMRSLKELLYVVLLHLEKEGRIDYGLCSFNMNLLRNSIISSDEYYVLDDLIWKYVEGLYLFPSGLYEARVEWLKERIEEIE
jgi:hypothetical protein